MTPIGFYMSWTDSDRQRLRKMVQVMRWYWIGVAVLALVLPGGDRAPALRSMAGVVVGGMPAVMRAAAASFDPAFIEVFVALCLLWSAALAAWSLVWIPRGSHVRFDSPGMKATYVGLGLLVWLVAWFSVWFARPEISLAGGRGGALLYFGTRSRIGAVAALGTLWGFSQLFFFLALRISLVSPSSPRGAAQPTDA